MAQQHNHLIFTRDLVRQVDRRAIEEFHIPGIVLMENAARGLALQALQMLGWPHQKPQGRVLILCGGGNNGGDGLAAARHLHNTGVQSTIILLKPPQSYDGDAKTNLEICRAMNLNIVPTLEDPVAALKQLPPHALVIDGLLGTGLTSNVRPPLSNVIEWINDQPAPVLAIDIPSGLDCDSGLPLGIAVKAAATVTFVGIKRGFTQPGAQQYTGRITVTDIGAPRELVESIGRGSDD